MMPMKCLKHAIRSFQSKKCNCVAIQDVQRILDTFQNIVAKQEKQKTIKFLSQYILNSDSIYKYYKAPICPLFS